MTKAKKQLKAKTAAQYSALELWAAVLKRTPAFRTEAGGRIFRECGDRFEYLTPSRDRAEAIEALIDLDAIDLSPAGAYQMIMES